MYSALADAVMILHVLYVGYVVVGQLVVVIAGTFRTEWGRNPYFRWSHLLAIGIVALEELMDWVCPLTTWEQRLRELAGQPWGGDTFLARLGHALIFSKADGADRWPPEVFTAVHLAFAAVVLQAFVMYPPRGFRFRSRRPGDLLQGRD